MTLLLLALAAPLERAHSHNDYRQARPLAEALAHGFRSVEADVFLVDGRLLVGHDPSELRPERTLTGLYLKPLAQWLARESPGRPMHLLVDLKSDGARALPVLQLELGVCRRALESGRLRVIVSGDRPVEAVLSDPSGWLRLDGRPDDLGRGIPAERMPWVSDSWARWCRWTGVGPVVPGELVRVRDLVRRVHGEGRRLRFWGHPDRPEVWRLLWDEGVDFINTDRPGELAAWMRARAVSSRAARRVGAWG